MDIFYVGKNDSLRVETTNNRTQTLKKLHQIGIEQLHLSQEPSKILTTDMDGVLIVDDNALDLCKIIAGEEGVQYFKQVADKNIKAVANGQTSYCWNAPCVFVGSLLNGLPTQINRIVGKHMRFIPGAKKNIEQLQTLGYDITNVTAGHQEGAEEVSKRLGIEKTIATQFGKKEGFGKEDGIYNGKILRFIGGEHKLQAVKDILLEDELWQGTHVGDSHSDIETMQSHPASIAWNPTHHIATHSARINVFGTDKQGLTPFYDVNGELDSQIPNKALPIKLVIYEDRENINTPEAEISAVPNQVSAISNIQAEWGQAMRKHYGNQIENSLSYEEMRFRISREILATTGLSPKDFQALIRKANGSVFLPTNEFQQNALKAYERL